jgi:hypothetical protein
MSLIWLLLRDSHIRLVSPERGEMLLIWLSERYSHVAPGLQEAAAAGFDKMVLPRRENEPVENHY